MEGTRFALAIFVPEYFDVSIIVETPLAQGLHELIFNT
jgi:hypothetical protein